MAVAEGLDQAGHREGDQLEVEQAPDTIDVEVNTEVLIFQFRPVSVGEEGFDQEDTRSEMESNKRDNIDSVRNVRTKDEIGQGGRSEDTNNAGIKSD